MLQNLGGIANLTLVPAGGALDQLIAFDTGPANMVIDALGQRLFGKPYDRGGRLAAAGTPSEPVLATLLRDPYYRLRPPKSAGREQYGASFVERLLALARQRRLSPHDILATATALTSRSIALAWRLFLAPHLADAHPSTTSLPAAARAIKPSCACSPPISHPSTAASRPPTTSAYPPKPRKPWPSHCSRGTPGIASRATSLPPRAPRTRQFSVKSPMSKRSCRGLLYAAFAVCTLALAGCGGKPDPNIAVMLIESSPVNLDPRIGLDAQSERIDMLIFDSLVKKDESYEVQPWLAKSWDQPDPVTYVFHLRPGVRFHNGQPLTSADVKWSIDSTHNGTVITAKSGAFIQVDHVDAPDPLTCVVHLKRPDPFLLWNLSDGALGIVPAGSGKDFWRRPIGTGAYKFVSQQQDKDVILARNEDSWQPKPPIPHLRFNVVPDDTTRALELQKGSADAAINALEPDTVHALRSNPLLAIQSTPGTIVNYINLNLRDPYLRDVRVRQAVAMAINRKLILDTIWRGQARLADDLLPPGHWARTDDIAHYPYDPAKAKALLDAAGYRPGPDGMRFHVEMKISNANNPTRLMALVIQQELRAVGIAMDVRIYEFGTFFADVTKGAFGMYALRWIGGNESPDIFRLAYATASLPPHGANRGHYVNPELDELMADAAASTDRDRDRADYVKVQQIVARDVPTIPLWYQDNVVVHTRRLQHIEVSASGSYDFLKTAALAH